MVKVPSFFFAFLIGLAIPLHANAHHDAKEKSTDVIDSFKLEVNANLLAGLPRTQVSASTHDEPAQQWEGVELIDILRKAKAPVDVQLRGKALAKLVRITAADGYQVIFSLAELDAGFANAQVLVVDTQNGNALSPETGPFRLVVPGDKRAGRWVRNVKTIELLDAQPVQQKGDEL